MSTSSVRRPLQVATPSRNVLLARPRSDEVRPFAIWLRLMGYVALVKLVLDTFLPDAFALPAQAFSWQAIIISAVAGLAGIGFARTTGFSPAWAPGVSAAKELAVPALVGFGTLDSRPRLPG